MINVVFNRVIPAETLEPLFWQTVTVQTVNEVTSLRERVAALEAVVGKLLVALEGAQAGPGAGKIIRPGPGGFVKPGG